MKKGAGYERSRPLSERWRKQLAADGSVRRVARTSGSGGLVSVDRTAGLLGTFWIATDIHGNMRCNADGTMEKTQEKKGDFHSALSVALPLKGCVAGTFAVEFKWESMRNSNCGLTTADLDLSASPSNFRHSWAFAYWKSGTAFVTDKDGIVNGWSTVF